MVMVLVLSPRNGDSISLAPQPGCRQGTLGWAEAEPQNHQRIKVRGQPTIESSRMMFT